MSRLIDADALMEYVQNQKSKTIDCNDIARFPTVYDVDAVVEELKARAIEFEIFGMCNDFVEISHAIEIIKRGR